MQNFFGHQSGCAGSPNCGTKLEADRTERPPGEPMNISIQGRAAMVLVAALAGAPRLARAQTTNFNIAAGLSLANGDFGARNDAGYALIVGIGMTQRASPISLRAEGIYTEYNASGRDTKSHAGGITGNAVYDFSLSNSGAL